MADYVCVDANLALSWVLPDPFTERADRLSEEWAHGGVSLVAPAIFPFEVTSIIRLWSYRGDLRTADVSRLLEESFEWPIAIWPDSADLQRSALLLASRFNHPRAYDAQYLALTQALNCDFWTGDERLKNSLQGQLPWVHWVGDYHP